MAGITSLLRSAAATRKKIQAHQDAMVAFEWENSAQTYDDFVQYSGFLQDRAKTADPSDSLTYQTKLRSARRSYVSNELQRAQIEIMEGRAGTQDKMNAVKDLYYEAVENGDFNLAQNLYSQYDALSIKLQNEQEAAVKAFQAKAAQGNKVYDDLVRDLTKGVDDVTLPNGEVVTPLAQIARDLETTGGSSATWDAAQDTLEAIRATIIDQYQNATTQEQVDKLEETFGKGLQDIDKEIFLQAGGQKLNLQQVVNAAAQEQFNNPLYGLRAVYNEATGETEYKLLPNKVERIDYARQFDEQGNEYYAPLAVRTDQEKVFFGNSDQARALDTQITDAGEVIGSQFDQAGKDVGNVRAGQAQAERNDANKISERLKRLGIIARGEGAALMIKLPGENVERQATIQPDGSLRFFSNDGQMVEVGLVDRNLGTDISPQIFRAGEQRIVSPEEVSDFSRASAFGGTLSQGSAQGNRYINDIMGNSPVQSITGNLSGPIRTGNDFSGFGGAVTSQLLQSAGQTRQLIQLQVEKQRMIQAEQEAAARLQASQTFNLNQVPIQQLTSSGILKRQLQVAAPTPTPRVVVAAPAPTPRVTVAAPSPTPVISGVGVAPYSGRVTVR